MPDTRYLLWLVLVSAAITWDLAREPGHYLVIQEIDRILATA